MPKEQKVLLGYADTKSKHPGEEVYVGMGHLVATGITQRSGKTTALKALAERSGATLLVFATKPGEEVYAGARNVKPFFKERADWEYVEALLEALLKEKQKYNRYWIIEVCRGARTLRDIDKKLTDYLGDKKSRPDTQKYQAYTLLHEYFKMVIPELEKIEWATEFPELASGINVMDLTSMDVEVQSLVIEACLSWILKRGSGIIVEISELWKFEPEGRKTPVKYPLESLIRQGAVKRNYVWFDSQDLAGVSKAPLKQVSIWLLGLQMERNEVKHTLEQIPLPKSKRPDPDDIMTLKVGHFILATPDEVVRVYVQPVWLPSDEARAVAMGEMGLKEIAGKEPENQEVEEDPMWKEKAEELERKLAVALQDNEERKKHIEGLVQNIANNEKRLHELEQYEGFADALRLLVVNELEQHGQKVKGLAVSSGNSPISIEAGITTVEVTHRESPPRKYNTEDPAGQFMYILCKDFNGGLATTESIKERAMEYGWNADAIAKTVGTLVRDQHVLKGFIPKKGTAYRVPKKIKLFVDGKEMTGEGQNQ